MKNEIQLLNFLNEVDIKLGVNANGDLVVRGGKEKLTPELLASIKQFKRQLVVLLSNEQVGSTASIIKPAERQLKEPLSYAQKRLWLDEQIGERNSRYNIPAALELHGILDYQALDKAFEQIVARHAVLRSVISVDEKGNPYQTIMPAASFKCDWVDLSDLDGAEVEKPLSQLVLAESMLEFDISADLMLRARLIKCSEQRHVLCLTMHHIASDGWSMSVLVNEFKAFYGAELTKVKGGEQQPKAILPEPEVQYVDYAIWQEKLHESESFNEQLQYWVNALEDAPPLHSLPVDHSRPAIQSFRGGHVQTVLSTELLSRLQKLCREQDVTLFMALHAAFSVLISRYSYSRDIVMGTSVANREQPQVEGLIGFFVNTLVLRLDLQHEPSFTELMAQSKQVLLGAYERQQVPFEKVVEAINPERSLSHTPLFQIMLSMQNNKALELSLPDLSIDSFPIESTTAKYDFSLDISETSDALILNWEYSSDLFLQDNIAGLAAHFTVLMESLCGNPEINVFDAGIQTKPILSPSGAPQQLDTPPDFKQIQRYFEDWAKSTPDAICLSTDELEMTYSEVEQRANQAARYLTELCGVKTGDLIAVQLERSVYFAVYVLAVLKAGCVYVPIDPEFPSGRKEQIIVNSDIKLVICTESGLETKNVVYINVSDLAIYQQITAMSDAPMIVGKGSRDNQQLASVVYTSGSTGTPKGVMIEHKNIASLVIDSDFVPLSPQTVTLFNSSVAFDAATFELWGALLNGGRCVVATGHKQTIQELENSLVEHKVNTAWLTSGLFDQFANHCEVSLGELHYLLIGGDIINLNSVSLMREKYPHIKLINGYGPTENTTFTTTYNINTCHAQSHSIPIGKPLKNRGCYILDDKLRIVPEGGIGELYAFGSGVARGYLNAEKLTSEKFVNNPHSCSNHDARLYRTGDLVRYLQDGNIQFIGRKDDQVKIRGFRVELGEIQHSLLEIDQVKACIVLTREAAGGDKQLIAWLQVDDTEFAHYQALSAEQKFSCKQKIRAALAKQLPDHFVPQFFEIIAEFPLTANGKIDRRKLPAPDITETTSAYAPPANGLEQKLVEIWADLFGVEQLKISRHANFFDIGGHSLLASKFCAEIRASLSKSLTLKDVFEYQSVAQMANYLQRQPELEQGTRISDYDIQNQKPVPASYAQRRLWFIDQLQGGSTEYNNCNQISIAADIDIEAVEKAIIKLVERHVPLRTVFKETADSLVQRVLPEVNFTLRHCDLSHLDNATREQQLKQLIAGQQLETFCLSSDLMLRATYVHLDNQNPDCKGYLLLTFHHIAFDGVSYGVFTREFKQIYQALMTQRDANLAPLPVSYIQYALWQQDLLATDNAAGQVAYWLERLAGIPEVHSLPLDAPRPAQQSHEGTLFEQDIAPELHTQIAEFCLQQNVTLFMFLQTLFALWVGRYSNETDVVMSIPVAGRNDRDLQGLVGYFADNQVIRTTLSAQQSFLALLQSSKAAFLQDQDNLAIPYDMLVEELNLARSLSYSPLTQLRFSLDNFNTDSSDRQQSTVAGEQFTDTSSRYELGLYVKQRNDILNFAWVGTKALFSGQTLAHFNASFHTLLNEALQDPHKTLYELNVLPEQVRQELTQWNDTSVNSPLDLCLHQVFEAQASQTPDNMALVFGNRQFSYHELNQKANYLAHWLIAQKRINNQASGGIVGILMERSAEAVIAMLAILKSGQAYVPIDPAYPARRIQYMLEDAGVSIVLTGSKYASQNSLQHSLKQDPDSGPLWRNLDLDYTSQFGEQSQENPQTTNRVTDIAFVIYTSGSTGKPKGVQLSHAAVLDYCYSGIAQYYSDAAAGSYVLTSLSFGVTVPSLYIPLMTGGCVNMAESGRDVAQLWSALSRSEQPLLVRATPSHIRGLSANQNVLPASSMPHKFVIGGDRFSAHELTLLRDFYPKATIYNHYGCTEVVVGCCLFDTTGYQPEKDALIPIGCPLHNAKLYVVGKNGEILPPGVVGELHVARRHLASGYLNMVQESQQRFYDNPYSEQQDEKIFSPGDLVKLNRQGALEYVGRRDNQVKIRGFRIELTEIETALKGCDGIDDALLVSKQISNDNETSLVAYLVASQSLEANQQERLQQALRSQLQQLLPDYMIPTLFVFIDAIPLSPNGKVDRKQLPEPVASQSQFVAPRSNTEKQLCGVWQQVLGLVNVGLNDNFFEHGGHSLSATRLISKVNDVLACDLQVKDVFLYPTVKNMADVIDKRGDGAARPPIVAVPKGTPLPLSYAQQRMWLLDKIEGVSVQYNLPYAVNLKGILQYHLLEQVFSDIVERHQSLRTAFFVDQDGQPIQKVMKTEPVALPIVDLSQVDAGLIDHQIAEIQAREAARVFDFSSGQLLAVKLLKVTYTHHILLLTFHHIASDGWSLGILVDEFVQLYNFYAKAESRLPHEGHLHTRDYPLSPLPIQYSDYAVWQRNWLTGAQLDQQLGYWRTKLADLPGVHNIPLDYPRPAQQTYAGALHKSRIDSHTLQQLLSLCSANQATLFMGVHAVFSTLLSRYSGESDIVIGTPVANREQAEVENLIGFFINNLVIRTNSSEASNFISLLQQSKNTLLEAYNHQQVPFDQIVEAVQPERSTSHSPLFQVMLDFQNNEQGSLHLDDIDMSALETAHTVAKYDINLHVSESDNGLLLGWEYNTDLFKAETITRMAEHFGQLLQSLLQTPLTPVAETNMLSEQERDTLLAIARDGDKAVEIRHQRLLHEGVLLQIQNNPDNTAIQSHAADLSYGQLGRYVQRVAQQLRENDAKPNELIAVVMEKGWQQVVAVLGILSAGGAYLPVDANLPAERIEMLLRLGEVRQVVTTPEVQEALSFDDELQVFEVQRLAAEQTLPPLDPASALCNSVNDLAYVIFTSGSTGTPKGVMIDHKGAANTVDDVCARHNLTEKDSVFAVSNLNFDLSVFDIFGLLGVGGTVVLPHSDETRDPTRWWQYLLSLNITVWNSVPALVQMLMTSKPAAQHEIPLQVILMSGDWIPVQLPREVQSCYPHISQISMGGATEASIWSISYPILDPQADRKSILYGKAMTNQHMYVLQKNLSPTPVGLIGEIYIGGIGVAMGYWKDEQKTKASFIQHPDYGERLYKTGDMGRLLPDGNIEFLGRIDHQVKIRGFRIELGEIEHLLIDYDQVKDALVTVKALAPNEQHLVGYILLNSGCEQASVIDELNEILRRKLPQHMLPSSLCVLDSFPITSNGKVDLKALPMPQWHGTKYDYVSPSTATERMLCDVWQEVLQLEKVSVTDNFFEVGGSSLSASKMLIKVNELLEHPIPLRSIFIEATIEKIALNIDAIQLNKTGLDETEEDELERGVL